MWHHLEKDAIQELICLVPLNGPYLQHVYHIIRDAVTRTDRWTWMQDFENKDGRQTIKSLCDQKNFNSLLNVLFHTATSHAVLF